MLERRRSVRVTAREGELAMLPLALTVQVLDISGAGVLLQSTRFVEPGTRGSLRLSLDGAAFNANITIHRVVARRGAAGGYRLGASFVGMASESRKLLEQFTSH